MSRAASRMTNCSHGLPLNSDCRECRADGILEDDHNSILLMSETYRDSVAHYWIHTAGTGVWRKARKPSVCCHGTERHVINIGDRYLDTGERTAGGVWATYKCCEACANAVQS